MPWFSFGRGHDVALTAAWLAAPAKYSIAIKHHGTNHYESLAEQNDHLPPRPSALHLI
ncbi:hypothetical protein N9K47_00020 [bacterium]|nr:hypothetical protein [bacterium]